MNLHVDLGIIIQLLIVGVLLAMVRLTVEQIRTQAALLQEMKDHKAQDAVNFADLKTDIREVRSAQ